MNPTELKAFMRQISREKDLDIGIVKEAIEQAIVSASKRNLSQFSEARTEINIDTGELRLFVQKTVSNIVTNTRTQLSLAEAKKLKSDAQFGDIIEVEIDPAIFGRIAAQSARQVVMQKLRDAERLKVCAEFQGKENEIISGVVQRFEKRDYVLGVGKAEALLPRNEVPPTARYRLNDRLKVMLLKIDPEARGPIIVVSRTHPNLVAKLFEQEVPEIADGTVRIVKVVRDPGSRTKIAVESTNKDVDPVGACVGVKGSRVQMIVRELENEKIDIVPYNDNPRVFIASALVPAQIQTININEETRTAEVIVKQGNLSLAIGKRGQNARLAYRLTGWKLEIHSEGEEKRLASVDQEDIRRKYLEDFLNQADKVDAAMLDNIHNSPYNSVLALAQALPEEVAHLFNGDADIAAAVIEDASVYLEELREMTQRDFGGEDGGEESETESDAGDQDTGEDAPGSSDDTGDASSDAETAPATP